MAKKGNGINRLINEAIDASIEFEAKMDSIDFNSYLPEGKESDDVEKTEKYQIYKNMVGTALEYCQDVIDNIPTKIKDFTPPENPDKNKLTQYLIFHLFEAKKIRLKARKQTKWEDEKKKYIGASHRLHKAFYNIPKDKFYETQKDRIKRLEDDFNWAKVLYYNEFAICYSGLVESSMSLGYAERAKKLLGELYPAIGKVYENKEDYSRKLKEGIEKKEGKNNIEEMVDRALALYTFALYNKGEAERLLRNYDSSERTFREVIEIYKDKKTKPSDYNSALLRMAFILIDQGRGKEALELLGRVKNLEKNDYRKEECDIERASAFIDQKKYEAAREKLDGYKEGLTFTYRKASLYRVRCLLEWCKNKPTEFKKKEKCEWKKEYENIPQTTKEILIKCIERRDSDNFKKACKYFSEFHKPKKGEISSKLTQENKGKAREIEERGLCGYFLYLFHERMDDVKNRGLRDKDWKDVEKELYENEDYLDRVLDEIEDTEYMKDFFNSYTEYLKCNPDDPDRRIIEKLYKRLRDLYREKDELRRLGEIEAKYADCQSRIPQIEGSESVPKSVETFFKEKFIAPNKGKYLLPTTIEHVMEKNTLQFVRKALKKSEQNMPDSPKEDITCILVVLRRWNSFTPTLASTVDPSKGGGYFLYFEAKDRDKNGKKTLGIIVDPGYDFLDNFFFEGFTIADIDLVLISHAHPDHTDNLSRMLSLFHEMNSRLRRWYGKKENKSPTDRKHIKIVVSKGVFDIFEKQLRYSEESLEDIYVVDTKSIRESIEKGKEPKSVEERNIDENWKMTIKAIPTFHGDLSQWETIGFKFSVSNGNVERKIGFTSDARWARFKAQDTNKRPNVDKLSKHFKDCEIVCAHLGSIINILNGETFSNTFGKGNKGVDSKRIQEHAKEKSHLYLSGLSLFFNELLEDDSNKLKLAIISEFGEELKGGIRMDLYHKFDDWFQEEGKNKFKSVPRCLPGDIGLRVDIFSGDVFCQSCERYVDRNKISPIAYGKEEAIFFVCGECKSVLSIYQIEEKLRDYYENGRKLELADESK